MSTTSINRWAISGAVVCAGAAAVALWPHATSASVRSADGTKWSVVNRARVASDDVSSWKLPVDTPFALKGANARVVYRDAKKQVAVVPTNGVPCLATHLTAGGFGLSCATSTDETPTSVSYDGAIGLVPDEVKSVTYTMTDGTSQTQQVVNNIWRSPLEASKASFLLHGSEQIVDLMPASSKPADATVSADGGTMTVGNRPATATP